MSGAQTFEDLYHLAAESHAVVDGACLTDGTTTAPTLPSAQLFAKYSQMQAEYNLWSLRMHDITAHSGDISTDVLIAGLAEEAARAVLMSGHLALTGILPSNLMWILASKWLRADRGAAELRQQTLIARDSTSQSCLPESSVDCIRLCKVGYLRYAQDAQWWNSGGRFELGRMGPVLLAVDAAEYMLRAPTIVWNSRCEASQSRSQRALPRPLGDVTALLEGLTQLETDANNISRGVEQETSRRQLWLREHVLK